jgi:hypothetical protein
VTMRPSLRTKISVPRRRDILTSSILLGLCALTPSFVVAQPAAQGVSCFEIIPAVRNGLPASSILLNKCSGTTHVLTRVDRGKARAGYEWVPIGTREAHQPPQKPAKTSAGRKCFSFDGREFCQ